MKALLLFVTLLAVPFVASAQAPAPPAPAQPAPTEPSGDWQAIVARDLRFRLEMPAPAEQTTAEEKERGHAGGRTAWAAKRDDEMFDFDFVDYQEAWFASRDTKAMARELGRGEAEKAFPRSTYKYARDEAVTLQGWDGYALDIEDAQGNSVMMRTWIVRDRLYRLLVTHKGDMKTRSAATRFLDSLRFAETRP
jgi:hypothetical protein